MALNAELGRDATLAHRYVDFLFFFILLLFDYSCPIFPPIAGKVSETWKQNQVLRCPINTSGVYLPPALPLFLTFGPELHGVWSN